MTMQEAKEFFCKYYGSSYGMCHDDGQMYHEFCQLQLSDETIENWRQDIIQHLFEKLGRNEEKEYYSTFIHFAMDVINASKTDITRNFDQLLDYIKMAANLDEKQKIYIMEDMGGRPQNYYYGGIYIICSKTDLKRKLFDVMNTLSNFCCSTENRQRYNEAIQAIQGAYYRFE